MNACLGLLGIILGKHCGGADEFVDFGCGFICGGVHLLQYSKYPMDLISRWGSPESIGWPADRLAIERVDDDGLWVSLVG